ncbi:phosphatase (plasmid) [Fulvitalea axinellae]|uniref:Phosphatase n=1 Tax=Fulvitalea axinellae TaxID=1182444 RepID=A0AAU9CSQ7_9BACT|nr:phosphatase [Fulvitalea axinellae]
MNIELVVFDMAGTTVSDSDNVHKALIEALAEFGVRSDRQDANEVMGYPKPVAIRMILEKRLPNPMDINEEMVSDIYEEFEKRMIRFYETDTAVKEKPNASKTFRTLKDAGIKVALDTGFARPIADAIIKRLGWAENNLLDFTVTSDEVENGRPHPDMVFKAMEVLDVTEAKRVAKIGDTVSDLMQGTDAGCSIVIGVTTGAYSAEELRQHPHTHLIQDLSELPEILGIHVKG